jgi:transcriptional regulator with XRE-family HTH domain
MLPPMENATPAQLFSARLLEVCADKGIHPGRGIQSELGRVFGVVPNAAAKWLKGIGMPEMQMAVKIAAWGGVNVTWLLQGVGPKKGTTVSMMSIVIDDALHNLPFEISRDVLDYLKFKLQSQFSATDPRRLRYEQAISAVIETLRPKAAVDRPFGASEKRPTLAA